MPSAIDVFREQREAAEQVHARLSDLSSLLWQLRQEVTALALNEELRTVLQHEQNWPQRAQLAVSEVRSFREQEMLRFWPGVVRRWVVALAFALASAPCRSVRSPGSTDVDRARPEVGSLAEDVSQTRVLRE